MAIAVRRPDSIRAVIFDLDEALLVREGAWRYAVEEAVASVAGRRVDAAPLAAEYRHRPWHHALAILLDDRDQVNRTTRLCQEFYERSAMKRLLVHEGVGMALDRLRGDCIEMGAVTHERHALALKQLESTGLDRFLTVLAPTAAGAAWDLAARLADAIGYLGVPPSATAFIGTDAQDLAAAARAGLVVHQAGWAAAECRGDWDVLPTPASLERFLPPR